LIQIMCGDPSHPATAPLSTCPSGRPPPSIPSRNLSSGIARLKRAGRIVADHEMPPTRARVNIVVEVNVALPSAADRAAPLDRDPCRECGRTPSAPDFGSPHGAVPHIGGLVWAGLRRAEMSRQQHPGPTRRLDTGYRSRRDPVHRRSGQLKPGDVEGNSVTRGVVTNFRPKIAIGEQSALNSQGKPCSIADHVNAASMRSQARRSLCTSEEAT
jgi:hypothetical protein